MIGFFGSLEIETGMGEEEVSYAGFQFANSRDFVFFVLEEGDGVGLCFGGRRGETVEERERVYILFVKGGDLGFGELVWPLA